MDWSALLLSGSPWAALLFLTVGHVRLLQTGRVMSRRQFDDRVADKERVAKFYEETADRALNVLMESQRQTMALVSKLQTTLDELLKANGKGPT